MPRSCSQLIHVQFRMPRTCSGVIHGRFYDHTACRSRCPGLAPGWLTSRHGDKKRESPRSKSGASRAERACRCRNEREKPGASPGHRKPGRISNPSLEVDALEMRPTAADPVETRAKIRAQGRPVEAGSEERRIMVHGLVHRSLERCGISVRGIGLLFAGWSLALAGCQISDAANNSLSPLVGPPRLVVPRAPLDLGQGVPGEELSGEVLLKNGGGEVLRIEKLESGCGCAILNISEKEIAPGAQARLQVAVRIKEEGQHLQFPVHIHSNDPATPETIYTVRADAAAPLVRSYPAQVEFGEVPVGTTPAKRVTLLKPDGMPWPVSEPVTALSAHGLAQADPGCSAGDAGAEALTLDIRLRPDLSPGSFTDTISVQPAGSAPRLQIPVHGIIVLRFVVSPSALYFGDVERPAEKGSDRAVPKRYVLLRRTDGKALNRVVRSTGPPGIKLAEEQSRDTTVARDRVRLLVTLDPSALTDDVKDGKLLLWLEDEHDPLVIRIMVFFRKMDALSEQ
jgi:hypothetical protein